MKYQLSTDRPFETVKESLSQSLNDISLFQMAYKIAFNKDVVYGRISGNKLWMIRPYEENVPTYLRIPPRRIFFAEISEADGTTQIKGKFRFPLAYLLIVLIVFADFLLGSFQTFSAPELADVISALIPVLFLVLIFLYGYLGNRKSEKRTIEFLEEFLAETRNNEHV